MNVPQSQALHAITRGPKAACGRRPRREAIARSKDDTTCVDCLAALRADTCAQGSGPLIND